MSFQQDGSYTIVLQQKKALPAVPEAVTSYLYSQPFEGRALSRSSSHAGRDAERKFKDIAAAATKLQALRGKCSDTCKSVTCPCSNCHDHCIAPELLERAETEAYHHVGHRQSFRKTTIVD